MRIRAEIDCGARASALWPVVRDLATRSRFLPESAARDVRGGRDEVTFEARTPKGGWTTVTCRVSAESPPDWLEERAGGPGLAYQARWEVSDGRLAVAIEYEADGLPRLLAGAIKPVVEGQLRESMRRIARAAEEPLAEPRSGA